MRGRLAEAVTAVPFPSDGAGPPDDTAAGSGRAEPGRSHPSAHISATVETVRTSRDITGRFIPLNYLILAVTSFSIDPGPLAVPFTRNIDRLNSLSFADALWSKRLDVWTTDPAVQGKIANRLGWLEVLAFVTPQLGRLRDFAGSIREAGFTDVVLLGMGGSSLAPEVLRQVLGVAPGYPQFRMLDSVDPEAVRAAFDRPATTLFILASKSGSTIEPNSMAAEARRLVIEA